MPLKKKIYGFDPRLVIADDNLVLNSNVTRLILTNQCKTIKTVVTLIRSMQTIALATVRVFLAELGITCRFLSN